MSMCSYASRTTPIRSRPDEPHGRGRAAPLAPAHLHRMNGPSPRPRQPRGIPAGGQFTAASKGRPDVSLSRHSEPVEWTPSPEDPEVLWASVPDGDGGEFALDVARLDSYMTTSSDYDVPHRVERWGWTVRSGDGGHEKASGVAANQATAAKAAVAAANDLAAQPEWLRQDGPGQFSTPDGYRVIASERLHQGRPRTVYLVRDHHYVQVGMATRLADAADAIEAHREDRGPVADPVAELRVRPFGQVTDLRELDQHYEMVTSPENISWDGERSSAAVKAEHAALQEAYRRRRAQIDPDAAFAHCRSCGRVPAGVQGVPLPHSGTTGNPCPGGEA